MAFRCVCMETGNHFGRLLGWLNSLLMLAEVLMAITDLSR